MTANLLSSMDNLYGQLPTVTCKSCGTCCVSPTCTLAEFVYLMDFCVKNIPAQTLTDLLRQPARMHATCAGNLVCKFLQNKQCLVHDGRTGACRLFGVPTLSELNIASMEECAHGITVAQGQSDIEFIQDWLDDLFTYNQTLFACFSAPYFIKGLNLECWLDIYFENALDFDVFIDIRKIMHDNVDLHFLAERWKPLTSIKEKIDKIAVFHAMLGAAPVSELQDLLFSIRDDYPLTGTYYFEEAQAYLFRIEQESKPGH
ncbi:MAG: hypothetical protein PHC61_08085 [Chitinivibrionales bacterium]|nr:hypothetical protein [Chitinivibrionales bacterium]